jgi:hypothetical protein
MILLSNLKYFELINLKPEVMKNPLCLLAFISLITPVSAQWFGPGATTGSGHMYYSGGNVGLGTHVPWSPMTVGGDLTLFNPVQANSGVAALIFNNPNISGANTTSNLARIYAVTASALYASNLVFDIRSGNAVYEAMRLNHSGFLGIGTTNPSERLEVAGKLRVSENGSDYSVLSHTSNQSETGYNAVWPDQHERAFIIKANAYMDGYGAGGGGFQFWTYDKNDGGAWGSYSGGLKRAMVIRRNGRVGIGTVNPQSELAVNGIITSKEVNVTLAGWSDYVFQSDYRLMTLPEVESFIQKNGHLPEVPSASTVLTNGVNVGEMSNITIRKIEELTLYVIQLNKEKEALQKQNQDLEQRLLKIEKILKTKE